MGIDSVSADGVAASRVIIVGGAGFIGSHFVDHLLAAGCPAVTVYDNFSSGRASHLAAHQADKRLAVIDADAKDAAALGSAVEGHDLVIHLAANPDIAAAIATPNIDFEEGTVLTRNVLEAMRLTGCPRLLYASGSGVYGDLGDRVVSEDGGNGLPISTYGASKLACEALISAYCHMFDLSACIFRFGNVVGPRQTHGVGYDFVRKLRADPKTLEILGDGRQSKPYVHVDDVIAAVLLAHDRCGAGVEAFNVAPDDSITVTEIADLTVACLRLPPDSVAYAYTGGRRGWKGDVPVVRLNTQRIRDLGWSCRNSSGEAIRRSLDALAEEARRDG